MRNLIKPKGSTVNHQLPQIIAILSGSLAGFSEGLLFSWTSPAIPQLLADNSTDISFEEASYFTVLSPIAMALSAPLFSILIDMIGRKKSVILIAVPQLLAWILKGTANNVWLFYASRLMSGIGDAALFATIPVYVCEIAEPKVRGTWGNSMVISIYAGIFLINVIGAYTDIPTMSLICGCIPLFHVIIFAFMPESPYYLLMKGRDKEAEESLQLLRWRTDVHEELALLKLDVQRQTSESGTMKDLLTIDSNRKALMISMGVRIAQQFSGLPAFEMHTQYTFKQAGGDVSEKLAAIIFSGVLVICVILASFLVEKIGRKPLMIFSSFGCGIVLTIETIYFVMIQYTDYDLSDLGWLPLFGMISYIVICSTGLGILPTLMSGELFSASIKGKAASITNVTIAACILIVPKLFQTMTTNFGIFAPFCFFSSCCFLSTLFSCFYVVETKGKTLEEIQQELKGCKKIQNSCNINKS